MASITYSGTFGNVSAGSTGKSLTLTSTASLPSNAVIQSVKYSLDMKADKYSRDYEWCMYWFAIGSTTGSPYARKRVSDSNYVAVEKMTDISTTLTGNMTFSQSDVSKFNGKSVTLYTKVNTNHPTATSRMGDVSITITYVLSSIKAPSNLKINSATSYTGQTAPLTWTAATLTNVTGTITYSIRKNGVQFATTTSTSYTVAESVTKGWGTSAVTITIVASGAGLTSSATSGVTYTYKPKLTGASNLKVNNTTSFIGQTASLTWTAGKLSNSASVSYSIRIDGTEVGTTTATSYTITEATLKQYKTQVTITIVTSGANQTATSGGVTFTYKSPDKTIAYYDGAKWVTCLVYYHDGSNWIKCDPYYYTNSSWISCSIT